jgi:hypothetical protein
VNDLSTDPRAQDAGPFDVFAPRTGAVVLVLETPEVAAIAADVLGLDWAPGGAGY